MPLLMSEAEFTTRMNAAKEIVVAWLNNLNRDTMGNPPAVVKAACDFLTLDFQGILKDTKET